MGLTGFTAKKFKDTFIVTNGNEVPLTGLLEVKSEGCTTYEVVKEGIEILPGSSTTIVPGYDGQYRITLSNGIDEGYVFIPHYVALISKIVGDIHYILCDCAPDSNCSDCTYSEGCVQQLSTMLKIVSYQNLTHPQHAVFLEAVFEILQCSVNDLSVKLVADEQTTGQADYVALLNKILSLYYLAFYHSEVKQSSAEELEYINTKFDYASISGCIDEQLQLEVQTKIDNMGTFTIVSGAYINLPPVSGDNTLERPNRVTTTLTFDMFPYTEPENDPIDAMKIVSIDGNNLGTYLFDNAPIYPDLIIPITALAEGRLVHVGADADAVVNDQFTYLLRDTVSQRWG